NFSVGVDTTGQAWAWGDNSLSQLGNGSAGGTSTTPMQVKTGLSASSLNQPARVAVDSSGGLYVADEFNSRVLYYPSGSTSATRVYGQPDFSSAVVNNGGVSATSLNHPNGLAVDGAGGLYVADT